MKTNCPLAVATSFAANALLRLAGAALLLGSCTLFAWCQERVKTINEYVHNSWRTEDGLPQNSVQAILHTRDGYLWLGTQEGLARFNGINFTVFNKEHTPSFRHNDVRTLFEDNQGTLWIGTFGGGLLEYRNGQFRAYTRADRLSSETVSAITQDKSGTLWVGTNAGLHRFQAGQFNRQGPSETINALSVDSAGDLWVATNNGLSRISQANFELPIQRFLPDIVVKTLFAASSGDLWIGTETQGVFRFSGGQLQHYGPEYGLPKVGVRAVLEDNHLLWVGTGAAGLCRLMEDVPGSKFECYTSRKGVGGDSLKSLFSVKSLFKDRENSLWVGTTTGGLNRLKEGAFTALGGILGPDDSVRSIYEGRDGSLWVAMDTGLRRYKDGKLKLYSTSKGPASNFPWSVIEDREGNVWLGSHESGLHKFSKKGIRTYTTADGLIANRVYAVFQDHAGDIWVGTSKGISRFSHDKFTNYTRKDGLSTEHIWAIFEDHANNLWFGTDIGVTLFQQGKFTNFDFANHEQGLPAGGVDYIYEDRDHVLWLGTDGSGLKRFQDGKFTATYTTASGLADDTVWAILEDDLGNFWLSSNRGIFKVSKNELNDLSAGKIGRVNAISYGLSDGLPVAECNGGSQGTGLETKDGRLLFACVRAVVAVNPHRFRRNTLPPPIVIEQVMINGVAATDHARVPVGWGDAEFHFAALTYLEPDKVTYQFKLEGNDSDWSPLAARRE